jgi:hypothetical protein
MACQVKDHFRTSFVNYVFYSREVRQIGLPPMSIARASRSPRSVDGMHFGPLLAQTKAEMRADESVGSCNQDSLSFKAHPHL